MKRLVAAIACMVFLLAFGVFSESEAAKRGGTLKIGIEGNVAHLDGTTALGTIIKFYRETMGAGLLTLDENYKIVPDLAKRWEVSNNGRTITFYLHEGGTFHDGTPLDAAAVKWNFDLFSGRVVPDWLKKAREKNPKLKFNSSYKLYLYQVTKAEVVDKYTVRIHQSDEGKAQTLPALAGYFTRLVLVSPTAYNRSVVDFRKHPIYAGPFKMVDYKPRRHVIMERHSGYFMKNRPYLDRIEVYYMPDATQRLNALRTGQIDVILNVPKGLVKTLKRTKGVDIYTGKAGTTFAFPVNNQRGPWKDIRVRRAMICYGVNRKLIVKTALRGLTVPWVTFSAPGSPDAIDLSAECPFDPAKAKQLLAAAGFGPSKPLKFVMTINNTDPTFVEIAQIMKTTYAGLGAQMDIRVVDRATWVNIFVRKRVVDMTLQDTVPVLDTNSNSHTFYSKTFLDYYMMKDKKLDAIVDKWRATMDSAKRREISHQMQRYMFDNMYFAALAGSPYIQAVRSHVKGWVFRNKMVFDFKDTWLDK
ncbi:MAG: ABC transporter substrate-binding protein [bacterium]|nr:ABC transporter substrate-binding protein [bacterium]